MCRKHGISDATFYTWWSRYGSIEIYDVRKLKGLEEKKAKLKKLLMESMLDVSTPKEMLAKKVLTPGARRTAVTWAMEWKRYSQRRACRPVELDSID